MDVTRRAFAALAGLALLAAGAGCSSDSPAGLTDDAMPLPATLFEAMTLAQAEARRWSENAQVARIGGGFTVMDAEGRARDHTFVWFARDGQIRRRLDQHLFSGVPWQIDQRVSEPDPPLDLSLYLDSDVMVPAAINVAEEINAQAMTDSIPITESFSARLSSRPAWPEPVGGVSADSVAWRVDFLELAPSPTNGTLVWWSTARFYFDPRTGELYEAVVPNQRELYPLPNL
jgi:hypothetical protein